MLTENHKEPIWTAELINRKSHATTFKTCGWCKYNGGGSARYNCMLQTHCTLLKPYGIGSEVFWDTECIVMQLGVTDIESLIEYPHKSDIRGYIAGIKKSKGLSLFLNIILIF